MKPILYDFGESLFTSNGLGRIDNTIECLVTEERNGIYECDFIVPVTDPRFDDILPGRSIAVTHDDSGDTQPFDIVSMSRPIDGKVTFHAVHVSYRLTGIVAKAKNINSLADAFQALVETAQPSDAMVFDFSADFTRNGYMAAFDGIPRTVRQLLGGVEGSVLDTYGGEYEFDRFRVVLHSARGQKRDFTIRYGVNLTEFNEDTDYQGTYTSCVPYWSGGDGGVIVTCNPLKVDSGFVSYDGRDTCIPLDLTEKFESKPTRAQLKNAALSVMQSRQTNLPSQNISVDFLRLQDFEEFKDFANLLECKLCDSIDVVFPRYNMRGSFKIVRTVWDVLEGRYKEMELGNLQTSLAEALGISDGSQGKVIDGRVYINGDDDVEVLGDLKVTGNINDIDISEVLTRSEFATTSEQASTGSIAPTTDSGDLTITATKAGWYPVAVAGFNMGGTNRMYQNIYEVTLSAQSAGSATVTYRFRNNANATFSGTFHVDILWIKIL